MLDKLRVSVRTRTPWEAADLGFALLRSQARTAFPLAALLVLPPALVLAWLLPGRPGFQILLFWWLKPLLDRPILHVLAKATFGSAPGVLETLRRFPAYGWKGLPAQLLWRRLAPERSLLLPVWQLEEADGPAFRARRRILVNRGRTQAQALTFTCLLFQALAFPIGVALLAFFWPSWDGDLLERIFGQGPAVGRPMKAFLTLLPTLAMVAVEPFYVAAGFGLYLNRRVELEGWDLEQAFRSLGDRARKLASRTLGACLLALLCLAPLRLAAQPTPKEAAREVLSGPEFASMEERWTFRPRNPSQAPPKPPPSWLGKLPALLKYLVPAGLAALLVYHLWRNRQTLLAAAGRLEDAPLPAQLFGLDLRAEALPRDLARAAEALWASGDVRGALSLLYRGALARLMLRLQVPPGPGATEGDCLQLARAALSPEGWDYFARLTRLWQGLAYAGRPAEPGDRSLCGEWDRHFGGGRP